MIKFFRHIRQSLIMENKTGTSSDRVSPKALAEAQASAKAGKYFKYAIGEIILVVIGILIALQINNWNENRKTKTIEQSLLSDLKVEVEANVAALEIVMESHQKSFDAASEIQKIVYNPEKLSTVTDSIIISLIFPMEHNMTYDPKLGTLNSIINSGKIDYIANKDLRYRLASLRDQIDDTNESANSMEQNRPILYYPILFKSFGLQTDNSWKPKLIEMFKNPEFVWFNNYVKSWRTDGIEEETNLLENLNTITKIIDSELKQ